MLLCGVYKIGLLHADKGVQQTRAYVSRLRFYYFLNFQKLRIAHNLKYMPLFIPGVVTLTIMEMKYRQENEKGQI